jgi:hypothetical protein
MNSLWIGATKIVEISIQNKMTYRFDAMQIPTTFEQQQKKIFFEYPYGAIIDHNRQSSLSQKNKDESITLHDLKIYYKATVIKTA